MADINDIQQDLQSIENLIEGPTGLKATKAALKRAIEAKLSASTGATVTIPDKNPLKMYDDYVYQINVDDENNRRTLVLDNDLDLSQSSIVYIDPNGGIKTDPEDIVTFPGEEGKTYSAFSGAVINRPSDLIAANIVTGATIFGVSGTYDISGTRVNLTGIDVINTDVAEGKMFIDGTGATLPGILPDYRTDVQGSKTVSIIPSEVKKEGNNSYINSYIDTNESDSYIINGNTKLQLSANDLANIQGTDLDPKNIRYGSSIFGVPGTFTKFDPDEGDNKSAVNSNLLGEGAIAYINGGRVEGRVPKNDPQRDISIGQDGVANIKAGLYWYPQNNPGDIYRITLPEAEFNSTLNIISYDRPGYAATKNTLSLGKNLDINPVTEVATAGYIMKGEYPDLKTTVSAGNIIDQSYFTKEYLDSHGYTMINTNRMLANTVGVNSIGDVILGNIPVYSNSLVNWGKINYTTSTQTGSGIIISPSRFQEGYYDSTSNAMVTDEQIVLAYNQTITDPNNQIISDNIKAGTTLFGVTGTFIGDYTNLGSLDNNISSKSQEIIVGEGVTSGGTIKIDPAEQAKIIPQNIASNVDILGVMGSFTSDATATEGSILTGYTAYKNGQKITGKMLNNGNIYGTIRTAGGRFTINSGYTSGGYVSIDTTEQNKLKPENIRSGVTILGVAGQFTGGTNLTTEKDNNSNPSISAIGALTYDPTSTSLFKLNDPTSNNRFYFYEVNTSVTEHSSPSAQDKTYIGLVRNGTINLGIIPEIIENSIPSNYQYTLINVYYKKPDEQEYKNITHETYTGLSSDFVWEVEDGAEKALTIHRFNSEVDEPNYLGAKLDMVTEETLRRYWNAGSFNVRLKTKADFNVRYLIDTYTYNPNFLGTSNTFTRYNIFIDEADVGFNTNLLSQVTVTEDDVRSGKAFINASGEIAYGTNTNFMDITLEGDTLSII